MKRKMKEKVFFPFYIGLCFFLSSLLVGCGESNKLTFQGYIEGEYLYLSSLRSGLLEKLAVKRGQTVDAGDLLFQLENKNEQNELDKSQQDLIYAQAKLHDMQIGKRPEEIETIEAQLKQAQAEAKNANAQLTRNKKLILTGGISAQTLEDSYTKAITSDAKVEEIKSQLKIYNLSERENLIKAQQSTVESTKISILQAKWELEQKRVVTPKQGLIYDVLYQEGEYVAAGAPVIQLLPPTNIKVRFFVPEPLLANTHLGDKVSISTSGRANSFFAKVSYISANAEYTPPIIYSNETRSKLVFMVEASPEANIAASLHPGQPVSVSYHE